MCSHDKGTLLAGTFRHAGHLATGHWCPACNLLTWYAAGRPSLTQSRAADPEAREAGLRRWLEKELHDPR